MIVYFSDRKFNIIGHASTKLRRGLFIKDDAKTEDTESGVAVFDCKILYPSDARKKIDQCTSVGNYILRSNGSEKEFYTIIDREINAKKQEAYIYAEDAGLDLLNEVVGAYTADKAYPIKHYIDKFAYDSGFVIGINEVSQLQRKLSWEGECTATERIASVATQFDGCEISFSFDVKGLRVKNKYINIHKRRGKDIGVQLRINKEIDNIITTESVANLATALQCSGGMPEESENPITLNGYRYDDGDFYVDGTVLKSRKALQEWSRYIWTDEPNKASDVGHIVRTYTYDTTSQAELCSHAITKLKQICKPEVNYEVDIARLPEYVKIGDRINIVDHAGNLYVSARVLKLETSVCDQVHKATLGEYLIKKNGIAQKVADLAAEFKKTAISSAEAKRVSQIAKKSAEEAIKQADDALKESNLANTKSDEAIEAAGRANQSAAEAIDRSAAANDAVEGVKANVAEITKTVDDADAAAKEAKRAAQAAEEKAAEANESAEAAKTEAGKATISAGEATQMAVAAVDKADTAIGTATGAKETADEASEIAAAAKLDVAAALKDIEILESDLSTIENVMKAEYARKTDLTETQATLQSQITQNAAGLSSAVKRMETIDETANDAAKLAATARSEAQAAQAQADKAKSDADNAQSAADAAKLAADNAKADADKAQAAADAAQGVADTAEANLAKAEAELVAVKSRVGATEADILDAQAKVATAQTAADAAKADAKTASDKAQAAQNTANTAVSNAATAQSKADDAADKASKAQRTADAAQESLDSLTIGGRNLYVGASKYREDTPAITGASSDAYLYLSGTVYLEKDKVYTLQAVCDSPWSTSHGAAQGAGKGTIWIASEDRKYHRVFCGNGVDGGRHTWIFTHVGETGAHNLRVNGYTKATKFWDLKVESGNKATDWTPAPEDVQGQIDTAQGTADLAKANAKTAQDTADLAKANASTAQDKADKAAASASNAQSTADLAKENADKAQAELDTAKANLTAVTNRVGATEAEVEAAKADVVKAQNAADKANADALAAQKTADTAKADATTAQNAADKAKLAADNAQSAADKAKDAADKAQADVDALAVRTKTAETKIDQNSEQIALRATKEEVTKTLGGYYTKEQTDAAIQVRSNAITAEVSGTYATKKTLSDTQNAADEAKKIANSGAKRINTHLRMFTRTQWQNYGAVGHEENWTTGSGYDNTHIHVGDVAYVVGMVTDAGGSNDVAAMIYGEVTLVTISGVKMTSLYYLMGGEGGAYALANTARTNAQTAQSAADKAQNTINGLKIGGRNLLLNSAAYDDRTCDVGDTTINTGYIAVSPGETYTIGYDIKASGAQTAQTLLVQYYTTSGDNRNSYIWLQDAVTTAYTRKSHVITIPSGIYYVTLGIRSTSAYANTYRHIKVESGNKATDYTLAPEDTDQEITTLSTKLTAQADSIKAQASSIDSLGTRITHVEINSSGLSVSLDDTKAEIAKISAIKHLVSGYSTTMATLKNWAKDGINAGNWSVTSSAGVRVGDTAYIRCTNSDTGKYVYIIVEVQSIPNATTVNGISHGYIDPYATDLAENAQTAANNANSAASSAAGVASAAQGTANAAQAAASAAQNTINNLSVGGRNLLARKKIVYYKNSAAYNKGFKNTAADTMTSFRPVIQFYNASGTLLKDTVIGNIEIPSLSRNYGTMTYDKNDGIVARVRVKHNGNTQSCIVDFYVDFDVKKGESYTLSWHQVSNDPTSVGGLVLDNLKLERGNKATDYTEAPEDTQNKIDDASKTATNFMGFDSSGLQIGNKTSGSWSGFRTQITATAFNILNDVGETLASYGEKLIELGKNATDAVISLCGGKGQIKYDTEDDFIEVTGKNVRIRADDNASIYNENRTENYMSRICVSAASDGIHLYDLGYVLQGDGTGVIDIGIMVDIDASGISIDTVKGNDLGISIRGEKIDFVTEENQVTTSYSNLRYRTWHSGLFEVYGYIIATYANAHVLQKTVNLPITATAIYSVTSGQGQGGNSAQVLNEIAKVSANTTSITASMHDMDGPYKSDSQATIYVNVKGAWK